MNEFSAHDIRFSYLQEFKWVYNGFEWERGQEFSFWNSDTDSEVRFFFQIFGNEVYSWVTKKDFDWSQQTIIEFNVPK